MLDAGARLLIDVGYGEFTTNHVAELAGVAIGSLYEYFPDKETIVAEIVRRTVREIVEEVDRGLERAGGHDLESRLREWLHVMFAAVKVRRDLVRAISRDVPFLRDLDEVKTLQTTLLDVATRGSHAVDSPLLRKNREAVIYLLTVMSGHAIVESVVARPRHLALQDVEAAFQHIIVTVLTARPSA